jgi:type I restriction enzyme S subunit
VIESSRYLAYKDSGVRSIGEVPQGWGVKRLRTVADMLVSNIDKLTVEGELPVRLCNYVDVYKNDRITGSLPFMRATATKDEVDRFRLRSGDVLITKDSESWTDIGVAALVEYTAPELVCGYHLAILRARDETLDSRYLLRALQSQGVAVQLHVAANGVTRYGLSHDAIKSALLPVPPLAEQAAIVHFLDHADRRIRRYIAAKKKLIALLSEQKLAIIHRAVTRGLDPDIRLKGSGVEWLGDVPEHWDVPSLGAASMSIQTGPFGSQLHASEYIAGGTPVVNPSHMRAGSIYADAQVAVSEEKATDLERHRLKVGDVVMARRGDLGRCALVKDEQEGWLCGTGSLRIRPRLEVLEPSYLVELLGSSGIRDSLTLSSVGATMDNLNAGMVARLRLPVPPLHEQAAIMKRISQTSAAVRSAVARAQSEISLLQEYRTRMIADVVTGKLDVRDVSAQLPDEVAGPEPLDAIDALAEADESEVAADLDTAVEEAEA